MGQWKADGFNQWTADGYNGWTADGFQPPILPPGPSPAPVPSIPPIVQGTLIQTIPSYLYQQYADDDDLQAFVGAYNAATQTYVDWFNQANLPIYTQLTGDLLDWVAEGLYGFTRTQLATPVPTPLGTLNTEVLNSVSPLGTLNSYVPPTETFYTLTDDVFQRMLTWDFYKGDGKRFCMRWLKRRIMRFLVGTNGVDPQPSQANFTVGCENTQAISVSVSSHVLTVNINQILLSQIAQITPNVLTLFQLAFEGGNLELPLQYSSYVANIVTVLTAQATPQTLNTIGTAGTLTTPSTVITVLAGSGNYTYAWTWKTGGTGIAINSPTGEVTDFSASLALGSNVAGLALCTVTDVGTSNTTTVTVQVSIARVTAPVASISPSTLNVTGGSNSIATPSTTVNVTGGQAPYIFAWVQIAGPSGLIIDSPTSATTAFAASISAGTSANWTAECTVTDHYGQTTTINCAVDITRVSLVSASASPTSLSSASTAQTQTTPSSTVSASGGSGSYAFAYRWLTGGAGLTINSPTSAITSVTGTNMQPRTIYTGTLQCTVMDGYGQTANANVSVSIDCEFSGTAIFAWATKTVKVSEDPTIIEVGDGFSTTALNGFGSLVSSNISEGTLTGAYTLYNSVSETFETVLAITSAVNLGQNFFTNMMTSLGSATSASAVYTYVNGVASWTWDNNSLWSSGTPGPHYTITLT